MRYLNLIFLLLLTSNSVQSQPSFSHKHGFYDNPFSLTITPSASGSSLYFTTDGTIPGVTNGSRYTTPISIDTLTVIRAVELNNGQPGKVATCTYLFTDDIIHQPNNPEGYPSLWGKYTAISGTAIADYEMDPELMAIPGFADSVKAALLDIPVISLVTDKENLFSNVLDPVTGGIYIFTGPPLTNTTNGPGFGWERPVSFEYFDAGASIDLQVDCALEIQGNHGRRPEKSPKHSFRLTFKPPYGPTKLNYPLFGPDADSVQNTIILRAGFGNTWLHWGYGERDMAQYIRDRWTKDAHLAMGHYASHGSYAHLFLNGLYWGIYNPSERLDSKFAAMYLGGNEEDYDVIKDYTEVADGNITDWNTMMSLANAGLSGTEAYQKIQGNNPDGTRNPAGEPMVDVVNLADYMLLHFYGGNWDWDHHNWVAMRNRVYPGRGFKFFSWDGEHMIEGVDANILSENNNNCPSRVFQKLRENEDFRRLFADRVQKHCFGEGTLTASAARELWIRRSDQIEKAVHAESARWGDYRRDVHRWQTAPYELYTKEEHWTPQRDYVVNTYFPNRTESFLASLRAAGLFPSLDAPLFMINGSPAKTDRIALNDKLTMSSSAGEIYYTVDGSDPVTWEPSPVISARALRYSGQIVLKESSHFKARCFSEGNWSATSENFFLIPGDYNDIKVTEIHYHPTGTGSDDNSGFEFIELKNTGTSTLNLKGLRFIDGIDFVFSEDIALRPQEFFVLASNGRCFRDRYGFWPDGSFDGQLDNSGERIVLITAFGDTICSFRYSDGPDWPETPDGRGNSLVPVDYNPAGDQNNSGFWRASFKTGGSPGKDDKLYSEGISSGLLTIYPNYPNPFTSATTIKYKLTTFAQVTITIIDATGRNILSLEGRNRPAGIHEVEWNGLNREKCAAEAGLYFYRITAKNSNGSVILNGKMLKIN